MAGQTQALIHALEFGGRLHTDGLVQVALADAATAMAVNTLYVGSMAAWATADRLYTLPTNARRGDRIGIILTGGNATYTLTITAASGDTLNGVAGGTVWSRLFIAHEVVIMRCTTSDSVWEVEVDGRIACTTEIYLSTAASGEPAITDVQPTSYSGVWTAGVNNASCAVTASGSITIRRTGNYLLMVAGTNASTMADQKNFIARAKLSGATLILGRLTTSQSSPVYYVIPRAQRIYPLTAGDVIDYWYQSQEGSIGLMNYPPGSFLSCRECL